MSCDLVKSVLHHRHMSMGFWSVNLTDSWSAVAILDENP